MNIIVKFIPADHWWQRSKWELVEEYVSSNKEVTVPKGFITDGASIPFFARGYFSSTGRYFGAAIVHDYVLISERDWDKANGQFEKEMRALAIDSWRRHLMVAGVKTWAWFKSL